MRGLGALLLACLLLASVPPAPCGAGGPLVLYGSQTGAAEDVAHYLADRIRRRGLAPRCMAMDDYDIKGLAEERTLLCVASTTGDGVAPLNMRRAWQALCKKDLPPHALSGVDYAVFGLGDSTYAKYNAAARRLDARLAQLGARRLAKVGLGDDQDPLGEDTALGPWADAVLATLPLREPAAAAPGAYRVAMEEGHTSAAREMCAEEARGIVRSIAGMHQRVLFTQGTPLSGRALCAGSAAAVRALREAGLPFGFCDTLRSARVAEALRKAGTPPPVLYQGGVPTELAAALAVPGAPSAQAGSVGGGMGGAGEVGGRDAAQAWGALAAGARGPAGEGAAAPRERCLNDEWGGVGGEGHCWKPGQVRGGMKVGEALGSERLTAEWMRDRDVRHVRISVGDVGFAPGDVANILPRNRPVAVEDFLHTMGLNGSSRVRSIEPSDSSCAYAMSRLNVEAPCTVADLVSGHFDIEGVPRRRLIERLAEHATDGAHREKLLELASAEGGDELREYVCGGAVTVATLLRDFPSVRPGLEQLLDLMPRIRPRPYSIASSSQAHPGEVQICSALVERPSAGGGVRRGVCSSFLMNLRWGDAVPYTISGGSMAFDASRPAICVGPGTGIAPFRAFVWDRECRSQYNRTVLLFVGNRHRDGDFLYGEELQALEAGYAGALLALEKQEDVGRKQLAKGVSGSMLCLDQFFGGGVLKGGAKEDIDVAKLFGQGMSGGLQALQEGFKSCLRELEHGYQEGLKTLEQGKLEGLVVIPAFSRDEAGGSGSSRSSGDSGGGKVYVQDMIRQRAKEVWEVLASDGVVYVAGRRVGMPAGVREALEAVVGEEGGVADAKAYVDAMIKGGRYREEVW